MGPCFIPCRPTWLFCSFSVYGGLSFFTVINILPSLRPFLSGPKSLIGKTLGSSLGLRTPKLSLQFHQNLDLGKNWLFSSEICQEGSSLVYVTLSFWSKQVCVQSLWIPHSFPTISSESLLLYNSLSQKVGWLGNQPPGRHRAHSRYTLCSEMFHNSSFLIISINFNLPIFFFNHHFIMNIFKYTEKLKELYREHPYTHHWHSTINILQYLLYHVSVHLTIYKFILFFVAFQSKLKT